VHRAGGLWFSQVIAEAQARLADAPRDARAAFAAWCAEQALIASVPRLAENDRAARSRWMSALAKVWDSLDTRSDDAREVLAAELQAVDQALSTSEGETLDEDGVAACIYAVQTYVADDREAPGWAAQRAIDAVFPGAAMDSSDLATDALRPSVQQLLRKMQATVELLVSHGVNHSTLTQLRRVAY